MNLMFWKKNRDTTEESEDDALDMSEDIIESEESAEADSRHDEISEDTEDTNAEAEEEDGITTSKGLLIAGTVAGILILAATGFFGVKFFLSSHKQNQAPTNIQAVTQPTPSSGNQRIKLPPIGFRQAAKVQPDGNTNNIEASGEKNKETSVEANKIATSRTAQPPVTSTPANVDVPVKKDSELQTQTLSSNPNGDLIVGSKDPKSAAMALREMIDAMNAGSVASPENAAK